MTAQRKILFCFFLCTINSILVRAQSENEAVPFVEDLSSAMMYAEYPEGTDFEKILNDVATIPWKNVEHNGFSKPYDNKIYALKCDVTIPVSGYYFIESNYTMLEHLQLAVLKDGQIETITNNAGFIGAKNASTSLKPTFRLWLQNGQTSFVFLEKKRFSTARQQFTLFNALAYTDVAKTNNILSGILLGIFFILLGNGLVSWIMLRSMLYAFYSIYLIGLAVIFMISEGYFRLFDPSIQDHLYFALYYAIFFALLMIGIIFVRVIPVFSVFPSLKKISVVVISFAFVLLLLHHYTFINIPDWPLWIYKIANSLILLVPLFVIAMSIYFYYKDKDRRAFWFLVIFGLSFIFFSVFAMLPFFSIAHSNVQGFKWIILFEAVAFLLFLNRDFYLTREENTLLNITILEEKHKATIHFLDGITEERSRIAEHLHDEICSQLIFLKHSIASQNLLLKSPHELMNQLDHIYHKVRDVSHSLHPLVLQKYGLKKALEDHIRNLEDTHPDLSIDSEFFIDKLRFEPKIESFLYLSILELFTNTLKHTKANEIHLSISEKENQVIATYFDNGGGYDITSINQKGMGLQTISQRISSMGGNLNLAQLENGMQHTLILPTN